MYLLDRAREAPEENRGSFKIVRSKTLSRSEQHASIGYKCETAERNSAQLIKDIKILYVCFFDLVIADGQPKDVVDFFLRWVIIYQDTRNRMCGITPAELLLQVFQKAIGYKRHC